MDRVRLCVQVPHAGGRLFETGDEDFLNVASSVKVSVLIVFTQFDKLVNSVYSGLTAEERQRPTEETNILCIGKGHANFRISWYHCRIVLVFCASPAELRKAAVSQLWSHGSVEPMLADDTLANRGLAGKPHSKPDRQALAILIDRTQRLVEDLANVDPKEVLPIVSANAQRANAEVKIDNSIELGMKRYWKGLASSSKFLGWKFETCLSTIHEEITDSWNFNDSGNMSVPQVFHP
ncbi:hypothetical protein DFH09DRAFT_1092578 [Mycena vulgaris]|nr:hypothetical protein DFH09DRAFT_1092578 [Mycena vulgaris]